MLKLTNWNWNQPHKIFQNQNQRFLQKLKNHTTSMYKAVTIHPSRCSGRWFTLGLVDLDQFCSVLWTCVWIWTRSAVSCELVWTSSSSSCSSSWCCSCGNEIFLDICWIQNGSKQNGYYPIVMVVVVVVVCWLSSKWWYVAAAAGAHSLACSPAKEQWKNNSGQFSRASQGWMQPATQSIACCFENDTRWWYLQLGCSTIVEQGWKRHGYCFCIIRRANCEFLNAKAYGAYTWIMELVLNPSWQGPHPGNPD